MKAALIREIGGLPELAEVEGRRRVVIIREADTLEPGTRVYLSDDGLGGRGRDGTLAELATVVEEETLELPDGVSDELAAACGTAGLAGWLPVVWRAQVGPGDRVLVLGATGTVGLAAVRAWERANGSEDRGRRVHARD